MEQVAIIIIGFVCVFAVIFIIYKSDSININKQHEESVIQQSLLKEFQEKYPLLTDVEYLGVNFIIVDSGKMLHSISKSWFTPYLKLHRICSDGRVHEVIINGGNLPLVRLINQ